MKNKETGIKESAYALARKHNWALEYEGGLELDGEYLDDADLTWTATDKQGKTVHYVLNISWADSTAYGFTLTREDKAAPAGSSFGIFTGENLTGTPFENAQFALPTQGATLAEKYYITTLADLLEYIQEAVQAL